MRVLAGAAGVLVLVLGGGWLRTLATADVRASARKLALGGVGLVAVPLPLGSCWDGTG
jgi:hypothetical protein